MIPVGTNLKRTKLPAATLSLIGVNVIFFIGELILPEDALLWMFQHLGFGSATRNPFAPFVALFLHGDIYHIAFNMLFLWIFGGPVEERIGAKKFLLYYFCAGLAGGILSVVMEIIARPDSITPGIGASGAISGIMALFLYRCFYSKLKLVISPILLPRQVNIPVLPLILFWIFQDVIMGIFSMSHSTGVGHWAHVGGFIFGIVIGRVKRYGHEGQIEQLKEKILKKLEKGGGWKTAENELIKLLEIAPEDPEVHHDLARLYANNGQMKSAERHYQLAAQRYFASAPASGAYTVLEHAELLSKPMALQYHLRAANALIATEDFDGALKSLLPLSKYEKNKTPMAEKSLSQLVRLLQHLGRKEEAQEGVRMFLEKFPGSSAKGEIQETLSKKAGEVFLRRPAANESMDQKKRARGAREADSLSKIAFFEMIFADPIFWSLLLFLNIAAPFLFPRLYFSRLAPVYLFAASFVMTVIHRMGSISEIFHHMSAPSEKKVRQEVDLKRTYDDATLAEKRGRYSEAAEMYEHYLLNEPKHVQARFNLAKLYEKRLDDARKARMHYQALKGFLSPSHPFYHEVLDFLKKHVTT